MTAQIRPNRLEVSDRFPMLGFAIRTEEPNLDAEVVIANDIGLFEPANRARRSAANFYTSSEHGRLTVPRGEGVFVVPPEVLARFVGSDKLFFGLATGHAGNGGLRVDALPRPGSPYVSLHGFTGRSLRRGFGTVRTAPLFDWAGDAPRPGSQPAAPAPANAAPAPAVPAPAPHYDDGFGPMPAVPTRTAVQAAAMSADDALIDFPEDSVRMGPVVTPRADAPQATAMVAGADDYAKARRYAGDFSDIFTWTPPAAVVSAVNARGFSVQPIYAAAGDLNLDFYKVDIASFPIGYDGPRLLEKFITDINSFVDTGNTEFIPYDDSDRVKLTSADKVGAAFKLDIMGPDNAAVVISDHQHLRYGEYYAVTTIETPWGGSHPVSGHRQFGYYQTASGWVFYTRAADRSTAPVPGTEWMIWQGAEALWQGLQARMVAFINANGGSASARAPFSERFNATAVRLTFGNFDAPASTAMALGTGTSASDALAWIRDKIERGVAAVASDVSPPSLLRLGDASSTFTAVWQAALGITGLLVPTNAFLAALPSLAARTGVTLSIGPVLDTPLFGAGVGVVFAPDGQVALFGAGEISIDASGLREFVEHLKAQLTARIKLGYNNSGLDGFASLAKVASVTIGDEIAGGAEIWLNSANQGLGGAVSIGAGFALELGVEEANAAIVPPMLPGGARERANRIGGLFGARVGEALDLGLSEAAVTPLLDRLDPPARPVPLTPGVPVAMGMGGLAWSVNWDGVDVFGQPNGNACWATSAALLIGWRDSMSIDPQTIADRCSLPVDQGLDPSIVENLGRSLGLQSAPAACYTPEGFRQLITNHGPLWVGKMMGGSTGNSGHVVLVVGMYNDGSNDYLRIVDPWDRPVGAPGAPGNYPNTHLTGSRYIMRYEDFQSEYEMVPQLAPSANVLILHLADLGGRTPNTGTSPPSGYAMESRAPMRPAGRRSTPDERRVPASMLEEASPGAQLAIEAGKVIVGEIIKSSGTDISYQVDEFKGWHRPPQIAPQTPLNTTEESTVDIAWDDGGILDAIGLKLKVTWEHDGWSLGKVRIVPHGFNDATGDKLFVRVQIHDISRPFNGASVQDVASRKYVNNPGAILRLTISYQRERMIRNDVVEGKEVFLLPTGQYTEAELALD